MRKPAKTFILIAGGILTEDCHAQRSRPFPASRRLGQVIFRLLMVPPQAGALGAATLHLRIPGFALACHDMIGDEGSVGVDTKCEDNRA